MLQYACAISSPELAPRISWVSAMFSSYSVDTYGPLLGWENDMEALAFKEEAQQLMNYHECLEQPPLH